MQQLNKMHISDMRCRDDVRLIDVQTLFLPVQSSSACDANRLGNRLIKRQEDRTKVQKNGNRVAESWMADRDTE